MSDMAQPIESYMRPVDDALLRINQLNVNFGTKAGTVRAVSDLSLDVVPGETVSIVGESGSGKSTIARAVMGLLGNATGHIYFRGSDLLAMDRSEMRQTRPHLQMIFQDPIASLNPRRTIQDLISQGLRIWPGLAQDDIDEQVNRLLVDVGMNPAVVRDRRASEFSGGQCQRIAIARALALKPQLLVCDEPVSALDVSVQAQILNLLRRMKKSYGLTLLFISHDLSVVRNISDRVVVMYLGKVCEVGNADQIFSRPAHPYTNLLLESVPKMEREIRPTVASASEQPSPLAPPSGCRFRTRCPIATDLCAHVEPPLRRAGPDQFSFCHYAENGAGS
jgi:peptide/nickel transport system ATP-binding protein